MKTSSRKYRAFISYSHADEAIAARLHRTLESFTLPSDLGERGHERHVLRPVFRDRNELATSSRLGEAIEQALEQSDALIVIASPSASRSKWVNEEILQFRQRFPERPIHAFVADGRPEQDPRQSGDAAFPLSLILEDTVTPDGPVIEPLAADARKVGDGFQVASMKLVAGLIGVGFDALWRRQQKAKQRRWAMLSGALLALSLIFAVLTWQAMIARDLAEQAQAAAQLELTSERQTRQFLLSIFRLSGAGEARGDDITVRSVLDRAVSTIDATDFAKPVVKSRLLATMGQAYSSLGLNQPSIELLRRSIDLLDTTTELDLRQRISSHIELADVYFDMGDYDASLAELAAARAEIGLSPGNHVLQQASLENVLGDVYAYSGDSDRARSAYTAAMTLTEDRPDHPEQVASIRGRSLGGFALLEFFEGRPEQAMDYFEQAHQVLLAAFGSAHPDTNWALGSLGSAAKVAGDSALAESSWTEALEAARSMYDPGNPEIGTLQNNLARLAIEQGEIDRAGELLEEALQSDRLHRSEDFDGLVYTLNNLAIVRIHEADFETAERLLEEALPIAESRDHEMTGSVLTQLADVRCTRGRSGEAPVLIERALSWLAETYGPDDWRVTRARITRDYCAERVPEKADLDALRAHWGQDNPFVQRARIQADRNPASL